MEKKLPKVFVNPIDKKLNNNEKVFYSKEERSFELPKETSYKNIAFENVNQKIQRIFSSPRYVYKADVEIKLKDKTLLKRIIGKNGDYLITMENELIPIHDIVDIRFTN